MNALSLSKEDITQKICLGDFFRKCKIIFLGNSLVANEDKIGKKTTAVYKTVFNGRKQGLKDI